MAFSDESTGNPTSWEWDFGDGTPHSFDRNPNHTYNDPGDYTVTLWATNACGTDDEVKIDHIHVDTGGVVVKDFALSDIPVSGTVNGDFTDTHDSDDVYESITEEESGGNPKNRRSFLEHKWDFNVTGGSSVTFYVEGYRTDNTENDDFSFEYSTDDLTYTPLVTISTSTEQTYSAGMPSSLRDTVYIRVVDTDATKGNRSLETVYVDYMYIESVTGPTPPTADFVGDPTSGAAPLTVYFTDSSTGGPTSWEWAFGDGSPHSFDQHPTHVFSDTGHYTVSLTASNAYGSDTETRVDYITVTDSQVCVMHVSDIVVTRQSAGGPNRQAVAEVTVLDQSLQPVANATVYGFFNAPNTDTKTGVTNASGVATITSDKTKSPPGDWCFEVADVTHATCTYDPGANNVTRACESGWVWGEEGEMVSHTQPQGYELYQNHPNPFNPTADISFTLPEPGHVVLEVFNLLGQRVAVLADRAYSAGTHSVTWNAGEAFSGVYFYRLTTAAFTAKKKMLLLK